MLRGLLHSAAFCDVACGKVLENKERRETNPLPSTITFLA